MKDKGHRNPDQISKGRRNFLKGMIVTSTAAAVAGAIPASLAFAEPNTLPERELYSPMGLALLPDRSVFTADSGNYCVRRFRPDGTLAATIGSPGSGRGQFNYPTDVIVHDDRLFVLDTNNGRICVFKADSGKYLREFGALGGSSGNLFTPSGIAVMKNKILVANTRGHCCQIWDIEKGEVEAVIGMFGDEKGQLSRGDIDIRLRLPSAVAWHKDSDRIFIADSKHGRIVVTDAEGGYLDQYTCEDTGKPLSHPEDICVYKDELFIADTGNGRVVRIDVQSGDTKVLAGNWGNPVGLDVAEVSGSTYIVVSGGEGESAAKPLPVVLPG